MHVSNVICKYLEVNTRPLQCQFRIGIWEGEAQGFHTWQQVVEHAVIQTV